MIKKGQVSIFIVVGLFVLVILGLVIYINDGGSSTVVNSGIENNNQVMLRSYIETCLEQSLVESLEHISLQGGYYMAPADSFEINSVVSIPYYYDFEKGNLVPTIDEIRLNLEYVISDYVKF